MSLSVRSACAALIAMLSAGPAAHAAGEVTGTVDRPPVLVAPGVLTVRGSDTMLASKLGAVAVVSADGESIGDVQDTILARDGRIEAAIVGVGGVLGVGERLVAVPWSRLSVRDTEGGIEIVSELDRAALEAAPVFIEAVP